MEPEYDLVVVGAGGAGLLAAVAARRLGNRVLVVDADVLAGGSTASSDGLLWLPANQLSGRSGGHDSVTDAEQYLNALLGATTEASSTERRSAYARTSGKLARWLTSSNIALAPVKGLSDDNPDLPGGRSHGRIVAAQPFDRRLLGVWDASLRPAGTGRGPLGRLLPVRRTTRTAGEALAGHLLHRATANGVDVRLEVPVVDLLGDKDGVTGVVVRPDDVDVPITASRVLLANGGFEHNQGLREEYLPLPTDAAWSTLSAPNNGDLLAAAIAHGAATAELDEAWWTPVMLAEGRAWPLDEARVRPHGIIVDSAGDRFFDEALPPTAAGRALYERSRGMRAVPSFLVLDNRHRQAHELGPWAAGNTPKKALEAGEIVRANTMNDLAQALGVDRAGLLGTVVRYNGFAAKGKDLDFSRGEPASGKRRNTTLGKVDKPPFWAVKVYPGDAGTKGGLLVDASARVLRTDGTSLPGLYSCGGAAASLFKGTSPGPGAALGAALIEAFLAATDRPSDRPAG